MSYQADHKNQDANRLYAGQESKSAGPEQARQLSPPPFQLSASPVQRSFVPDQEEQIQQKAATPFQLKADPIQRQPPNGPTPTGGISPDPAVSPFMSAYNNVSNMITSGPSPGFSPTIFPSLMPDFNFGPMPGMPPGMMPPMGGGQGAIPVYEPGALGLGLNYTWGDGAAGDPYTTLGVGMSPTSGMTPYYPDGSVGMDLDAPNLGPYYGASLSGTF